MCPDIIFFFYLKFWFQFVTTIDQKQADLTLFHPGDSLRAVKQACIDP